MKMSFSGWVVLSIMGVYLVICKNGTKKVTRTKQINNINQRMTEKKRQALLQYRLINNIILLQQP